MGSPLRRADRLPRAAGRLRELAVTVPDAGDYGSCALAHCAAPVAGGPGGAAVGLAFLVTPARDAGGPARHRTAATTTDHLRRHRRFPRRCPLYRKKIDFQNGNEQMASSSSRNPSTGARGMLLKSSTGIMSARLREFPRGASADLLIVVEEPVLGVTARDRLLTFLPGLRTPALAASSPGTSVPAAPSVPTLTRSVASECRRRHRARTSAVRPWPEGRTALP
jgi:hypothetical protein